MGIADVLEPLNERIAARLGPFRAIGEPGLYETNESTPEGFYDDLRRRFRPDGYVYGPGCGNVLSMVEAFEDRPRGVVLVDLDPAVVLASRILVDVLRRRETAAGWAEELFCGGLDSARRLVDRALEAEASPSLRGHMEQHVERFLRGLAPLTDDFELTPRDVPDLLDRWAGFHPPRGRPVPVRTFLARNYDELRTLARDGDVAVLLGSLLDPEILEAVAELPEIGERTSLVYVSNIADHFRRRALRLDALARLKLAPDPESGDFLTYLNDRRLGRLQTLARVAGDVVSVRSVGVGSLSLEAVSGVPRYTEDDFGPALDLGRVVPLFLTRFTAAPGRPRALALDLYAAGITGESATLRTCLDALTRDAAARADEPESSGWDDDARWLAETVGPLVLLRRAGSLPDIPDLAEHVTVLAERVAEALHDAPDVSAEQPAMALRCAQALEGAGELLDRDDFRRSGRSLRTAAISASDPEIPALSDRAEMLLRITWIAATAREPELLEAAQPLALGLLGSLASGGAVKRLAVSGNGSRTLSEDLRLGLLLFGLLAEDVRALEAALFLDYRLRHPDDPTPEPDAILASLAREAHANVA